MAMVAMKHDWLVDGQIEASACEAALLSEVQLAFTRKHGLVLRAMDAETDEVGIEELIEALYLCGINLRCSDNLSPSLVSALTCLKEERKIIMNPTKHNLTRSEVGMLRLELQSIVYELCQSLVDQDGFELCQKAFSLLGNIWLLLLHIDFPHACNLLYNGVPLYAQIPIYDEW